MATYKDLVGTAVRNNAGNLTTADTGQVWFDSTNIDFKYLFPNVTTAGSWSSAPSLNTGRVEGGGAGTALGALMFGGDDGSSNTNKTEFYNGAWTEVNDMNTSKRYLGASGVTNTAALTFGGSDGNPGYLNETETWNGTSWTEVNNLQQA